MRKLSVFTAVIILLASWLTIPSRQACAEEPLIVFAASSLTNVITELSRQFDEQGNHHTVVSFAATSVLARQIKDGAPANVFISANTAWMDDLVAAGAVAADSRRIIAGNRLVLAGAGDIEFPPAAGMTLSSEYPLSGIAPDMPFAIGNPDHVPAGIYARQGLLSLGLWDDIKDRLIPMPNVRAVIANIDRGEVAGGFVYASDMRFASNSRIIASFPDASHDPIRYVAGIVRDRRTTTADSFLAFLLSPDAESVFIKFGFLPPTS